MESDHQNLLDEAMRHLNAVDGTALVVLKGHLLIEQELDKILKTFVFHPKFFGLAKLRFAQKIALARSISLDESENSMWSLALNINSLRNDLAHSLHSSKRARKIESVLSSLKREAAEQSKQFATAPEHTRIAVAVFLTLGFLSSFLQEVVRFRSLVDVLDHTVNPHRHEK
jgi:hypothetical protein